MDKKEIIKKLEAVVCELKDEKECKKGTYAEELNSRDEWVERGWYCSTVKKCATYIMSTVKYDYYNDSDVLRRIKK